MDDIQQNTIVIDPGSYEMRFGIGGEAEPIDIFKSRVGVPKYHKLMNHNLELNYDNISSQYCYVGNDITDENVSLYKLRYPIDSGIVNNWEDVETLFNYGFRRIDEYTTNYDKVIVSEPCLNNIEYREKITELMFEKYSISKIMFVMQGILALYGNGKLNGLVVDIGHTVSQITPIYEGYVIESGIARFDVSGSDLSEYLQRLLELEGYKLKLDNINHIKHSMEEFVTNTNYVLPDGTAIDINVNDISSEYLLPLFDPVLIGKDILGIHNLIINCITKCSIDTRKHLYSTIVLTGGTSNSYGLTQRLETELMAKLNRNIDIKLIHNHNTNLTWLGGSILSCLKDNCVWQNRE